MLNLFFFRKLVKIILRVKIFKNPLNLSLTPNKLIFSITSERSTIEKQLKQEKLINKKININKMLICELMKKILKIFFRWSLLFLKIKNKQKLNTTNSNKYNITFRDLTGSIEIIDDTQADKIKNKKG